MRHRLLGGLMQAPRAIGHASRTARVSYERSAGRLVDPVRRRLSETRAGGRVRGWGAAARARVQAELTRWEAAGRHEELEARALARVGVEDLYGGFLQRLAASPELQRLVEEQSAGLTRSALQSLRTMSADADSRVEGYLRRLWRSGRRPAPPTAPAPVGK